MGSGLYDNIKYFINFRKDTKETLYYLLQRIITLEKNMKNVQNKLVANDIKTHIKKIIILDWIIMTMMKILMIT